MQKMSSEIKKNIVEKIVPKEHILSTKCSCIGDVRKQIDRIDDAIIKLIAERRYYVLQAAEFKTSESDVRAEKRVEEVIGKVRSKAERYGADAAMVEKLYREMIEEFIHIERKKFMDK